MSFGFPVFEPREINLDKMTYEKGKVHQERERQVAEMTVQAPNKGGKSFTVKISFDPNKTTSEIETKVNKDSKILLKMENLKKYAEAMQTLGFETEFHIHRNNSTTVTYTNAAGEKKQLNLKDLNKKSFWKGNIEIIDRATTEELKLKKLTKEALFGRLNKAARIILGSDWESQGPAISASKAKQKAQKELGFSSSKFTSRLDEIKPPLTKAQRAQLKEAYFNHLRTIQKGDFDEFRKTSNNVYDMAEKIFRDNQISEKMPRFNAIFAHSLGEDLSLLAKKVESEFKEKGTEGRASHFHDHLSGVIAMALKDSKRGDSSLLPLFTIAFHSNNEAFFNELLNRYAIADYPGIQNGLTLARAEDKAAVSLPKYTRENAAKAAKEFAEIHGGKDSLFLSMFDINVEKTLGQNRLSSSQKAEFQMLYLKLVTAPDEQKQTFRDALEGFFTRLPFPNKPTKNDLRQLVIIYEPQDLSSSTS